MKWLLRRIEVEGKKDRTLLKFISYQDIIIMFLVFYVILQTTFTRHLVN